MLTLWQAEWCPFSHQVRMRLTELGVDVLLRQVPADRHARAALREATGQDGIPALVTDEGDVYVDTDDIVAYLDDTFPEPAGAHRHQVHFHADRDAWRRIAADA